MKGNIRWHEWLFLTTVVGLLGPTSVALAQNTAQRTVRTMLSQQLPAFDVNRPSIDLIEVTYGPGAASPVHTHPCPVIGYVLDGVIRSQMKGQPAFTYHAGDSFYEPPNGVHLISANGSNTKPAKLLAIFVCDHAAPLSTPLPDGGK